LTLSRVNILPVQYKLLELN